MYCMEPTGNQSLHQGKFWTCTLSRASTREGLERVYFTEPKNTEAFAAFVDACPVNNAHVPSLGLA